MFKQIPAGLNVPDDCNVIIEIPAHSEPVKYEVDKETGALIVDRFMTATMRYPCDYGYIPNTLAEDNDPIDVLVINPSPLLSGCMVRVRPIGMLNMTDESGKDPKILAVPINKLTKLYNHIEKPEDLFPLLLEQISHFFKHYKDLEEDKWVSIEGWEGPLAAKQEIMVGIDRYQKSKNKENVAMTDIHKTYQVVFCSCPNEEKATSLARKIIGSQLAACVNLIPNLQSVYRWQDEIETAKEILMIIKTTHKHYKKLEEFLIKLHPYECPEIIALPITQGLAGYLQWIDDTTVNNV